MNVSTFLQHFQISENPFRAEEARQDEVFTRVESVCHHPDFEKIRGNFRQPSTAIVCGEKGSGKTAIRLQIEDSVSRYNADNSDHRCLVVAYDDLNPVLDRYMRQARKGTDLKTLESFKLHDHMDGILNAIVPRIVDQCLGGLRGQPEPLIIEGDSAKVFRHLDPASKRDLVLLQISYDRAHAAPRRTRRLKRALRFRSESYLGVMKFLFGLLMIGTLAAAVGLAFTKEGNRWPVAIALVVLALLALGVGGRLLWQWSSVHRLGGQLARHLPVINRSAASFRESLMAMAPEAVTDAGLPADDTEESRYAMLARLRSAIRPLGYQSMIVLVDRVDEPSMINGDEELMRALVWPLLNNKFLQQDGVGIKLLLPVELSYLLKRERSDFYREARLDKQNLIERFTWSGATLYDLCTARLNACRSTMEPISLMEMFEPTVSQQDLVDALDQMQQPRDAFKFLYQLVQEHCSNTPEEEPRWQIARPTVDAVRKNQVERVSEMLRGARPA